MRITRPREAWFPCIDDPDGGKVLIRHLSPGERQEISEKSMPSRIDYEPDDEGNMKPIFSIEPNRSTERDMIYQKCIAEWEGFFDEDGKPLEYTHSNVLRAIGEIEGFSEFIDECRRTLESDILLDQKEQEKNSSSSASE